MGGTYGGPSSLISHHVYRVITSYISSNNGVLPFRRIGSRLKVTDFFQNLVFTKCICSFSKRGVTEPIKQLFIPPPHGHNFSLIGIFPANSVDDAFPHFCNP